MLYFYLNIIIIIIIIIIYHLKDLDCCYAYILTKGEKREKRKENKETKQKHTHKKGGGAEDTTLCIDRYYAYYYV